MSLRNGVRAWPCASPPGKLSGPDLKEGSRVRIFSRAGRIVIQPTRPRYKLRGLLAAITPQNLHGEVDWEQAGNEEW
jgi:antitoxin component of MazEF toxin-antitoxin module